MEATDSCLSLKVGVLLPNCPEYAVVVLGVSLVYQFFFTIAKVFSYFLPKLEEDNHILVQGF